MSSHWLVVCALLITAVWLQYLAAGPLAAGILAVAIIALATFDALRGGQ